MSQRTIGLGRLLITILLLTIAVLVGHQRGRTARSLTGVVQDLPTGLALSDYELSHRIELIAELVSNALSEEGFGYGPSVGEEFPFSDLTPINSTLTTMPSRYIALSSNLTCRACMAFLETLSMSIQADSMPLIFVNRDAHRSHPDDLNEMSWPNVHVFSLFSDSPIGADLQIIPSIHFVTDGRVTYARHGALIADPSTLEAALAFSSNDPEQQGVTPIYTGLVVDSPPSIPLRTSAPVLNSSEPAEDLEFPETIAHGKHVLVSYDQTCDQCRELTPEIMALLQNWRGANIWILLSPNEATIDASHALASQYSWARVVQALPNGIGNTSAFLPWGRSVTPDILLFSDGAFVAGLISLTTEWGSAPGINDPVFLSALAQIGECLSFTPNSITDTTPSRVCHPSN